MLGREEKGITQLRSWKVPSLSVLLSQDETAPAVGSVLLDEEVRDHLSSSEATAGPPGISSFPWKCVYTIDFYQPAQLCCLRVRSRETCYTTRTSHNISYWYLAKSFWGLSLEEYHDFLPSMSMALGKMSHPFFMQSSVTFQGKRPCFRHPLAHGFPLIC